MISEKKYYQFINNRLIVKNKKIFYERDKEKVLKLEIPNAFDELLKLLDNVENKYEFDMQKMIVPNYNKFVLWQKCFMKNINEIQISLATQFVVFCCLADKILDSSRFTHKQKEAVCMKLNIENFISSNVYESESFKEMDVLINNIRTKLFLEQSHYTKEIQEIIDSIDKAFKSEIYMYKHSLKKKESFLQKDCYLLTDKSVQFEVAAFMIATLGENSNLSIEVAYEVGKIFWIIDDICDFIDDIRAERKNSLLFWGVYTDKEISLDERIIIAMNGLERIILLFEENLALLKKNSNSEFYTYILNEVWEWCADVREKANKRD